MKAVADAGVDLDDVFRVLEEEGVQKFVDSWDELTESVRTRARGQEIAEDPVLPTRRPVQAGAGRRPSPLTEDGT